MSRRVQNTATNDGSETCAIAIAMLVVSHSLHTVYLKLVSVRLVAKVTLANAAVLAMAKVAGVTSTAGYFASARALCITIAPARMGDCSFVACASVCVCSSSKRRLHIPAPSAHSLRCGVLDVA